MLFRSVSIHHSPQVFHPHPVENSLRTLRTRALHMVTSDGGLRTARHQNSSGGGGPKTEEGTAVQDIAAVRIDAMEHR